MKYDFETLVDRRAMKSHKWEGMLRRKPDIAKGIPPFSVADTDFLYPPQLIDGFKNYVDSMIFGYAAPSDSYYASFISWMKRRHDFDVKREWILDSSGVISAIYRAVSVFSELGDDIIIMTPVYPPFGNSIKHQNRKLVEVPLVLEDGLYTIDFDMFEKAAVEAKILIFCNPHNPVGRVWSKEELLKIASICNEHGVLVISDEIHMDLLLDDHIFTSYGSLNDESLKNSIILTSASKTFNIAGAQTSMMIIADKRKRSMMRKSQLQSADFGVNAFGFKLAEIAYTSCEDWFDELLELISYNHHYMYDFLVNNIPSVVPVHMEGTYLQWLDFSALKMSDEALHKFLIDKCSLQLTPGKEYGTGGNGFMRWNIATPTQTMMDGLRRLEEEIKKI